MASAKENLADSRGKENFVSSASEPSPQTLVPMERLLNVLIDLSFSNQSSDSPVKKESNLHSLNSVGASDKLPSLLAKDANLGENFVCPSTQPYHQTIVRNASPDRGCPQELIEQGRGTAHEITKDEPCTTLPANLPTSSLDGTGVAPLDRLLNLLVDLQIINHNLLSEAAPKVLVQSPESIKSRRVQTSDSNSSVQKKAALVEDLENVPLTLHLLEPAKELPNQSMSGNSESDDGNNSDALLQHLRSLLLTPEIANTQQVIAKLEKKLVNLERQIYEPSKLINLLLPLIAELLSLKVAESKEKVVEAIAPILDRMIQSRTEQDKVAMSTALAPVLSTAITQQISSNREEVTTALGPAMAGAIREQISVEREAMVDALYPVIGSTISKYMVEEIRAINEKIENSLSLEGFSRKLRAKVQGVSEAELILKEAMLFTVQAIFLIHQASGLVISEVQASDHYRLESEMVAGMLTAIRSFVNDCIAQPGSVLELDQIEYGNAKIILEGAGYCYLAVVIQGAPPQGFFRKMRQTLSRIVQSYGRPIELFDGNCTTTPELVQTLLEELMDGSSKRKPQSAKKPPALLVVGSVLLSLILLPWGIHHYRHGIDRRLESEIGSALASAPELAVYHLNVDAHEGFLKLSGKLPNQYLRQRAAQIAQGVVPNFRLDNSIIAVELPPDPVLAAAEVKRVTLIMNQMDGVVISAQYAANKVTVEGSVRSESDPRKITQAFAQIPGVYSVTNIVQPHEFKLATQIYFELASAKLKPADMEKIIQIKAFIDRYPGKQIRILGRSDPSGDGGQNEQLAKLRAEVVRDVLVSLGVNPSRLQVIKTTNYHLNPNNSQPLWLSRRVEFEIATKDNQSQ